MSEHQLESEKEKRKPLESPSDYALSQMHKGVSFYHIEKALIEEYGLDKDAAYKITRRLRDNYSQSSEYNEEAFRNMAIGGIICVIGIVVTVASYQSAANSPSGGSYVIAWGAVIFGAIQFFKAWTDR